MGSYSGCVSSGTWEAGVGVEGAVEGTPGGSERGPERRAAGGQAGGGRREGGGAAADGSPRERGHGPRRRPTGRRFGDSGTREAIVDAALDLFSERGYDGASMRAIAGQAGVDPALIRHFFGDKAGLFTAAMTARSGFFDVLTQALAVEPPERGRSVADAYLGLWEGVESGPVLVAMVRANVGSQEAATMMSRVMSSHVRAVLGAEDRPDEDLRLLYLVAAQMLGIAISRYVMRLEPVVQMEREDVLDAVAPVLQAALEALEG